jgi:SAM-dependent methyltransferase
MRNSYKGIPINTSKNTHEVIFSLISLEKNGHIVDIPSGAGAFVQRLLDNGYNNVTALDIENILEIDHKQFVQGDMTKPLPFADASVDAVVCIDGIEHINKQFFFVSEVMRILKKDGQFIISTPNISALRSRVKWLLSGHHHKCNSPLDEENPSPLHHIGMVSFPEIRYMLHTKGFRIETIATNRIKTVSWFYGWLVPFSWLFTSLVYQKAGRREGTGLQNKEIKKTMFSKAVLFGETMIVSARKK